MTAKKLKELKAFRAKLVMARELCCARNFDWWCVNAFMGSGLMNQCADTPIDYIMPPDVHSWYMDPIRTRAEREAMWDNSIAAIDAQIAKDKP